MVVFVHAVIDNVFLSHKQKCATNNAPTWMCEVVCFVRAVIDNVSVIHKRKCAESSMEVDRTHDGDKTQHICGDIPSRICGDKLNTSVEINPNIYVGIKPNTYAEVNQNICFSCCLDLYNALLGHWQMLVRPWVGSRFSTSIQ